MPRGDLVTPTDQRATQGTHLDGATLVVEIAAETVDELDREVRVAMIGDRRTTAQHFGCASFVPLAAAVPRALDEQREQAVRMVLEVRRREHSRS